MQLFLESRSPITGQITAATALVASDLPVSTTSAKGAVQITSGGGLTVDGSGNLTTSTSGISAGTYQSITVIIKALQPQVQH